MKVHNDLLLAADNVDVSALCLLDLTAAFDTVDHNLMVLERQFGLRGVVLDWFKSYLCGTPELIESSTVARRHILFTLYVPCLKVLF